MTFVASCFFKGGVTIENSKIFITGDIHGENSIKKLGFRRFTEGKNLRCKDYVIILGDFGLVWSNNRSDRYWLNWLEEKPWTTLFIDGNHENHNLLSEYPIENCFGGQVHLIRTNVIHLMRGEIYKIGDSTFFTMGGAQSQDIEHRKENVNWWRNELPDENELSRGENNLARYNNKVDYILTHCAPGKIQSRINKLYGENRLTQYFDKISEKVDFKKWFFGHYHISEFIDGKYAALYNSIYELKEQDL